jgi:hypothetical protein
MELATEYKFEERLGLMLPVVFREFYEKGKPAAQARMETAGLLYERIACEAKYSNFRRFEVFSRIR